MNLGKTKPRQNVLTYRKMQNIFNINNNKTNPNNILKTNEPHKTQTPNVKRYQQYIPQKVEEKRSRNANNETNNTTHLYLKIHKI